MQPQGPTGPATWTARHDRAAVLVAEDELTDDEIAAALKVTRDTISRWKRFEVFQVRVQEVRAELAAASHRRALGRRERRVRALDDRWRLLLQVIEERAADPAVSAVPGGSTGMLVRQLKGVGSGDNFQLVEEYEVDTGLLKELREHERQAAQELGQWSERHEVTGRDGKPIGYDLVALRALPPEELLRLHREALGLPAPGGGDAPGQGP